MFKHKLFLSTGWREGAYIYICDPLSISNYRTANAATTITASYVDVCLYALINM